MRTLLLVLTLFAIAAEAQSAKTNVTFKWDYPTNEFGTNIEFRLWHQTNLVPFYTMLTNIVAGVTNVVATNALVWNVATNISGLTSTGALSGAFYTFSVGLGIQPGNHFYVVTARWSQGLTNETTGEVVYLESDPSSNVVVLIPRRVGNLYIRP